MSTTKNAKTSKRKIENLQPKDQPQGGRGTHGGGGGAGKVSMQDFHF
jgi:hypothetical protein